MAFQVPASKASKGQDRFEFEIDGKTFSVRKAKFVPIDALVQLETAGLRTLEFFGGDNKTQIAAVGSLEREQFAALVLAWREDSEVTAGEAPASAS
jgi:hypothetical protein